MKTSVVLLFLVASARLAFSTAPKLTSIAPTGAQRGTELELRLSGARLDDTKEIVFYEPGIEVLNIESAKTNLVKVQVKILPDCSLGEHHLRLRAEGGVSELRTFQVGIFPVLAEVEPNNSLTNAQKVPLNTTVSGSIASEDTDCFTIDAKKGDRISAEVEGIRLGRSVFDSFMSLIDESGEILASSDDTALLLQDSFLSLIAPKDGRYAILLRDIGYGGGAEFVYRLHIGNFPRPTAVYPAGGKAGETVSVEFLGDAKGSFSQRIELPATQTAGEKFGAYAEQNGILAPSPNWMRVSPFTNVLESAGNHDREHATRAETEPPVALNGIISKKGEIDWFRFQGRKGQGLDISVYARRLRSPIDSVIEVFGSDGKSLGANDDAAGADSYLKFSPPADGEYFLSVKDHLGQGGSEYVYRVEITPTAPSLALSIPQVARNDSQTRQYVVVPQGNRFATMIAAKRKEFSGDFVLSMPDLPTGVGMQADTFSGKLDAIPVVFEASADAPIAGKLTDLLAKPVDTNKPVHSSFTHKVEMVPGPNNTYYYSTTVDKLYVAVTEPAPFKIRIVEPKIPLVQYGVMDLRIVAERAEGFDAPITIKMMFNPPGVGSLPDITIPKGESEGLYRLNANADASLRSYKIAVLGSATVKGGTVWASSQLTPLEVGAPYLIGKIEPVSGRPGESAKLVCKIEQKQGFEGAAKIKLLGLPEKVTAPEIEITKDSNEAVFSVQIDSKVPPGSHRALFCAVEIKKDSETISQNIAPNSILRILPPKRVKTAATTSDVQASAKSGEK